MIKKSKQHLIQLFLKNHLKEVDLFQLILKSIIMNQEIHPQRRYISSLTRTTHLNFPYKSSNRLHCIFSFKNRVPSHKIFVSRFYLARFGDTLRFSRLYKF